jgi:Zn-dependent peptidase ImmA (M78 family)
LWLNSNIWDRLPTDQKEFVLLHEKGHLRLQTGDEFRANQYAVKRFAPVNSFSNQKLGQKIMVMRDILDKADEDYSSNFTETLLAGAASGLASSIFQILPVLGVGSKSRQAETAANTAASIQLMNTQAELAAQKSKTTTKTILVVGVLALVVVVSILIIRKK